MKRAAVIAALLVGCGARPDHPVDDALYSDLRVIVVTEQRIDWLVDRVELDQIASRVMESVCQTPAPRRAALRSWLDGRLADAGGDARSVWLKSGKDLDAAQPLLELERIRGALTYGEAHLGEWLEPCGGEGGFSVLRVGPRVGIDWDP